MPSVTIDTCVLAAPPITSTHDEIVNYVDTLLDWSKLLKEDSVSIFMSEKAAQLMCEVNVYPFRPALKFLFQKKGVLIYDANTVALLIEQLLKETPYLEEYFEITDVLPNDLQTNPNLLSLHSSPVLASDLARIVVILAILRTSCTNPILNHSLIIKPWDGNIIVNVTTKIDIIETTRDDLENLPKPPKYFEGEVLTCTNFREFIMNLNEISIWKTATDDKGITLATRIAVYKNRLNRKKEPNWDDIHGFRFNSKFLSYMRDCEKGGAPKLVEKTLRAIVETIDGLNLDATHWLKTGPGGNDPQRTRGNDEAWRRDIDREYHLHYWKCDDETIEFASVGPHNMFECPE